MAMSACRTCGKSAKDKNSIIFNLCLTKIHLKFYYLDHGDSQHIKFSNKLWRYYNLKSGSHPPKKISFICFNDSPSKMIKNAFYFNLKALFVLKIFKCLP